MKIRSVRTQKRKTEETPQKTSGGLIIAGLLCTAVIAIVAISMVFGNSAKEVKKEIEVTATETWQEGIISYKGKYYKYNNRIDTYLLMGIDKAGPAESSEDYTAGGQSDAIFLLVLDKEAEEFSAISIHRNTMTEIEQYGKDGTPLGTHVTQLCLQHAYGDGKRLSCRRTQDAVSKLFDNLPISGYLSLYMDGIPVLNDAVGGVEVECLQDLSYPSAGVELHQGETVTLNGQEAYYYVRGRDTNTFDSATQRLRREEQYVAQFMKTVRSLPDKKSRLNTMYTDASDYIVTNISFADLLTDFSNYDLTSDHIYSVPGETIMGDEFEEFYVDEEGLYDLIIKVFYNEVPAEAQE